MIGANAVPPSCEDPGGWRWRMAAIEKQAMLDALQRCGGNKRRAAELMGMPRTTFFARVKEYDIA